MTHKTVTIGDSSVKQVTMSSELPFGLICGPCAIESRDMAMQTAETLTQMTEKLNIPFVYKSSFDKANRTSISGKRGAGLEEGLKILQEIRDTFKVPVLTDAHDAHQMPAVGEVVDVIQIPAFLCRQTDVLVAAANTGKVVNVKKGQFLAPHDMSNVAEKIAESGNEHILLTERGTSFGYNTLVTDYRGLRIMADTGYPVVFDATHSVQMPGGNGKSSGGKREFVEPLARAAVAVGVAGLFIESHPNPAVAFSDGPNMVPMDKLEGLLTTLKSLDDMVKGKAYQNIPSAA